MPKVELMIQACINGRPIWRKAKPMRAELTHRMNEREYSYVVDAAIKELSVQVKTSQDKATKVAVEK